MAQYKIRKRANVGAAVMDGGGKQVARVLGFAGEYAGISGAAKHFGLEAVSTFTAAEFKAAAAKIVGKEILPAVTTSSVEHTPFFTKLLEESLPEGREITSALVVFFRTKCENTGEQNIYKITKTI